MSRDEVTPVVSDTGLPAPIAKNLPQRLHAQAKELLELNSSDRAKLFKTFKQQPPGSMVVEQTIMQANMWQGPLPPPEHLERFNSVVPGAAERILAMAEKQQNHRIALEEHAVKEQLVQSKRGQLFGLVIGLGGILLAAFLAYLGFSTSAATVGSVALSGLAIAFIVGRTGQGTKSSKPTKQ